MRYPVMCPVLILFLAKEFFQFFAALLNYRKGKALDGALMAGKICTTVLFTSFTVLVFVPNMNPVIVEFIGFADCICLLIAFIRYIFAFCGKHAQVHDIEK
jgi:phosphatidylglycerophosphate synthase